MELYVMKLPCDGFPDVERREAYVIPVMEREGGILLALPVNFLPQEWVQLGQSGDAEAIFHSGGKGGPRKGGGSREAEKPRSRIPRAKPRSREAEKPRSRIPRAKPRSREAEKPNSPGEAEKPRMRTCPSLLPYILCTCPNMSCDSTHCTHVQTSDVIRVQSAIM